jgi:putative redox protein
MIQLKRVSQYTCTATDGEHTLTADEPVELGGKNLGMTPHRLLEASLAACTAITVQMYADRKQWPLEGADVEVSFVSEGEQSVLSRKIKFRGNLDPEQRARLLEIANKCPIHKVLTHPTTIQTELEASS